MASKKKSVTASSKTQHSKFYHEVGKSYIERVDTETVCFTIEELIARVGDDGLNEHELVKTAKGAILLCDVAKKEYKLFHTEKKLLKHLAGGLLCAEYRDLFRKLGGNIEDELREV